MRFFRISCGAKEPDKLNLKSLMVLKKIAGGDAHERTGEIKEYRCFEL